MLPRDVPVSWVQEILIKHGAYLGPTMHATQHDRYGRSQCKGTGMRSFHP
jgi:hypothetical protein